MLRSSIRDFSNCLFDNLSLLSRKMSTSTRRTGLSEASKKKSVGSKRSVVLSHKDVIKLDTSCVKALEKLVDPVLTRSLFGEIDLEEILTKCYLCLGVQDDDNKIVGAVFIDTHPNLPALPACEWENWLDTKYSLEGSTSRNTLWIRLVLWDMAYYFLFFKPIIHYIFQVKYVLSYCIMVVPPGKHRTDFLANLGTVVMPIDCTNPRSCQNLYLLQRENFVPKYKIRRAVEEDNDDLVPLIEAHAKRLKRCYGSYYIAEILTRSKDSGRQIIVAEYQEAAVAVMCLNENVNYAVLNEEFELVPYNGLRKPHPDDFVDLSLEAMRRSLENLQSRYEDDIQDIISSTSEHPKFSSEQEQLLHISSSESEYSLVFTSASLFMFQDDEDSKKDSASSLGGSEDSQALLDQYDRTARNIDEELLSGYSGTRYKVTRIPEFKGAPNAFCLEIGAAHPQHEQGLSLLFEASFQCYPDRDYCIMSIPATVPINKLSKYFGRVVPRATGSFPQELYVMHRNAMLGSMEVQEAGQHHLKQVMKLISTIPNYLMALQQFENCLANEKSPYSAFVFMCENQVVGMATLTEEFDVTYVMAHYDVFQVNPRVHKSGCYGVIETLIVSPIFQRHTKFILRELHRLADFDVLFYRHTPYDTTEAYRERPLNNVLQNLFPIMPRKGVEYDMGLLIEEDMAPEDAIVEKKEPFALYVSTVPIASASRYVFNQRIVVVGGCNISIAFLETLLIKQDPRYTMTFNNVTLLCRTGIAFGKVGSRVREEFLVKKHFYDARHMDMINLKTYVNIVQGRISKINRKEQIIVVNGTDFLYYDLLFLMTGDQVMRPLKANRVPFQEKPENVFVVNSALDANKAIVKLKSIYSIEKDHLKKVIIYGHFLQAHSTLNGLLVFGIPGRNMVLVEPFPYIMALEKRQRHNVTIYNDPDIDSAVYRHIKDEDIMVYPSYYFIDWEYDEDTNMITMAKFESRHKMLEIPCMAMFYFNEKEIPPRIYRVINDAGLVYDGRLVIDNKFRTNDPKIYGAGTLTKYSRKYWATNMIHKYFNRVEIGQRLGLQIKNMIFFGKDSEYDNGEDGGWNFHLDRGSDLVPRFEKPLMRYCRLPGGLYYFSVTKPGKRIPLETAINMENFGQVLTTGNCRNLNNQGYFRIHLNEFKRVETITCLTNFPIDVYNLHRLWGKHQQLLNNLQLRFEMVLISDLFEFFREPWTYAIYHDKFDEFLEDLNMIMTSTVGAEGESIIGELITAFQKNRWKPLNQDSVDLIEERFTQLNYPKIIEQKVLDFIRLHLDHLPMYAHPIVVRKLLRNYENSPLFS